MHDHGPSGGLGVMSCHSLCDLSVADDGLVSVPVSGYVHIENNGGGDQRDKSGDHEVAGAFSDEFVEECILLSVGFVGLDEFFHAAALVQKGLHLFGCRMEGGFKGNFRFNHEPNIHHVQRHFLAFRFQAQSQGIFHDAVFVGKEGAGSLSHFQNVAGRK